MFFANRPLCGFPGVFELSAAFVILRMFARELAVVGGMEGRCNSSLKPVWRAFDALVAAARVAL